MKKIILMYVYGDIATDARVQRAAKTLSQSYDVSVISSQCNKDFSNIPFKNLYVSDNFNSIFNYIRSIFQSYKIVKKVRPDCFYGHDYYSALLIKLLINRKYCNKIVYDAHELYIPEKSKHFSKRSRFFYYIEKSIIKHVDLIICANEERAKKMIEHYKLRTIPVVIRNISQLKVEEDKVDRNIKKKLDDFFLLPKLTVVYAGVVVSSRRIKELIEAVSQKNDKCKLLIVGKGEDLENLKIMAEEDNNLDSLFVGSLPYNNLGYVLSRCDIGFIYYPCDTLNNIYCASNKLYEYASVMLPILSNENPTMKKVLDDNKIGVAINDFAKGIDLVSRNIDEYKKNCDTFNLKNRWENESEKLLTEFNVHIFESVK